MKARRYETFDVPVDGGWLRVGRWGRGERVVLAAHGTTASHVSFHALADQLGDEVTLVAPDLRGRGGSRAVGGPFSMAAHADDLAAILDHLGAPAAAVVLGHSMGGFVAVVMAHRHPDRVRRVVLVDGGLPLDLGPLAGGPVDEMVAAVVRPALAGLRMTFPSVRAYIDYWLAHPAFAREWNYYCEELFTYDLIGEPPSLRSGVVEEAVLADAESQLVGDDVLPAIAALRHPVVFVRAPRGILDREPGLYPQGSLDQWRESVPQLREVVVPDVNHYTMLLSEQGAMAVADVVRTELG